METGDSTFITHLQDILQEEEEELWGGMDKHRKKSDDPQGYMLSKLRPKNRRMS